MLKKYKSKSCISLSVALPTGGTTHVSFNPVTGGGSVFYTSNEKIQAGLEKHPKFGRLFTLDVAAAVPQPTEQHRTGKAAVTKPKNVEQSVPKGDNVLQNGDDSDGKTVSHSTDDEVELKPVEMSCNDDAKDYLVDKFGISRTKLRNRTQIEESGKANGIKFVWV